MTNAEAPVASRPVLVVGAGPVGLSAALTLRARGLPVTVLEAEPADRQRPGSRAIFTHRESLEILERARPGLGWELADHGVVWQTKRCCYRGREVFARTYPPHNPGVLPPFVSLPQVDTERHLLDACKAAGVEFVWAAPVTGVISGAEEVRVETSTGQTWAAEYVVGADGARSAVREAIGARLDGSRSENSYVIVDLEEVTENPLPVERVFHYEHPAVGGRNVLLVPFAGGWRADLQCHEDDDAEAFSSPEGVRSWIAAVMGERYAERVTWVSTYRFLQVLAATFTDAHRRVLLVGEAAHLFAPFGARGMNSGIADADAAAMAIHRALEAGSPQVAQAAVEAFARDRHGAAEYNRAAAGAALAHLRAATPLRRAQRRLAAALAPFWARPGAWLDTAPYGPRTGRRGAGGKY